MIGGEKGGTGKSSVAVNLACIEAKDGADLLVVDTDRQQSAARFFGIRSEAVVQPYIACMQRRGKSLGKDLQKFFANKFDGFVKSLPHSPMFLQEGSPAAGISFFAPDRKSAKCRFKNRSRPWTSLEKVIKLLKSLNNKKINY